MKENYDNVVHFKMTSKMKNDINEKAKKRNESFSEVVRNCIENGLKMENLQFQKARILKEIDLL